MSRGGGGQGKPGSGGTEGFLRGGRPFVCDSLALPMRWRVDGGSGDDALSAESEWSDRLSLILSLFLTLSLFYSLSLSHASRRRHFLRCTCMNQCKRDLERLRANSAGVLSSVSRGKRRTGGSGVEVRVCVRAGLHAYAPCFVTATRPRTHTYTLTHSYTHSLTYA